MVTVFALIDALGWQYLEGQEFLDDILTHRTPLQTVLGFSSGAIPTILTGAPPAVTGHWNLFYYDPAGSPFRWLKSVQFLPDAVFDQLAKRGIAHRVYSYHEMSDEEILEQATKDIRERNASFFFLYLCEMDMFLHMHCKEPEQVQERLRRYDRGLRKVFQAAREVDPGATMTVISDHGMTPIDHHYDLVGDIEILGLKMPGDYLAVYDSTMARFWFFNDQAKQSICNRLESLSCGRILTDDDLRRLGDFFEDRRFGELIFLLHPGWLVSRSDFNGKGWMPNGMHGYHPEDSYSDAIFLSSSEPPVPVQTIADVYLCMQNAAGFTKSLEETNSP